MILFYEIKNRQNEPMLLAVRTVITHGGRQGLNEAQRGGFRGASNVLFLDLGVGYLEEYI